MLATARRQTPTRRGLLGAVALLGTVAVTGCTIGSGDPGEAGEGGTAEGGGTGEGAGSGGGGEGDVVDEDAPIDLGELPQSIATASVPATVDGDPEATLTVSLHELRRDGKRLIALFSFLVESSKEDEAHWLYDYLGDELWTPYLIDPVNLTKHTVLHNGAETAQTSSQGAEFRPGQTLHGYAMFAAPPEDVTAMDVMLVEGATPATGVEIR